MQNAKPIFIEEELDFCRSEKDGYLTVASKKRPEYQAQLINPAAQQIIKCCDGSHTIAQILELFGSKYPSTPVKRIERDILDTIVVLNQYGFLKWDGADPFKSEYDDYSRVLENGMWLGRTDERHFRFINDIFRKFEIIADPKKRMYVSPGTLVQDYNELTIRQKQYSYSENFYMLTKGDQSVALISLYTEHPKNSVFVINFVLIDENHGMEKELIVDVMLQFILKDPIFNEYNATKVKWELVDKNNDHYDWLVEGLRRNDFMQDYVSKNEHGMFNATVYAKYLIEAI